MQEEYRYDPLGRRVMVRTRRESELCNVSNAVCLSTITRFAWAGDQLLWELRAPGAEDSNLEATTGSGERFGRVSYTQGGGIDRPLALHKEGWQSILPHENWRGQFASGTCVPDATVPCGTVQWPGWRTNAYHYNTTTPQNEAWHGSLVDDMRDATGQMYRRNRYYDPGTGQFTQPDPIGIAGGLNVYGFAAGDPVTYGDPYGLGPCTWPIDVRECAEAATLAMLEGSLAALRVIASPFGGVEVGAAATGINSESGERIGVAGRVGRAAMIVAGFVPEAKVAANLRRTLKGAQGADVSVEQIGRFYRASWEVSGERGGASRAVWNKIINEDRETIRLYKDSYDRAGRFMHRKFKVPGERRVQ